MKTLNTFIQGNTYQMRFIGDSDLVTSLLCYKRTEKTVSFKSVHETFTRKIKVFNNEEYITLGSYSMAPSVRAVNR